MKTLIYGSGPIGRWLALRLAQTGQDVTLLARDETHRTLKHEGIQMVDGLTGEHHSARVTVVDRLDPEDDYELIIVAMQKAARLEVCPILALNKNVKHILFLGNDVSGFHGYLDHLDKTKVLLGFPGAGGGWQGSDLVFMDREKTNGSHGELFMGELDGSVRPRTLQINELFRSAHIKVHLEKDMDGWLKYHFAFMAPTVGIVFFKGGDIREVGTDKNAIRLYCTACREAGDVLRKIGYRRRQPPIFNLFYWIPGWLEPIVFSKLFDSRSGEIRFGLHAQTIGPELRALAEEFAELKTRSGRETPNLDILLRYVPRSNSSMNRKENVS